MRDVLIKTAQGAVILAACYGVGVLAGSTIGLLAARHM